MASKRRPKPLRTRVFERDGYACRFCGKHSHGGVGLQLQHIVPSEHAGAHRAANLITVCAECNVQTYRDYLAEVIGTRLDYFGSFTDNIESIDRLVKVAINDWHAEDAFANMLYVGVVTAVETYLSDTFIGTVLGDRLLVQKLVESDPEFSKRRFELSEIYKRLAELEDEVRNYLVDIVYHNLAKVKNLYTSVLSVEFPIDIGDLARAVERRHDIVHRSGKSKAGLWIHTKREDVIALAAVAREFVLFIDLQVRKCARRNGA